MTCRLDSLDMFGKFRKFALGDTLIKEFNFDQLVYFFFLFKSLPAFGAVSGPDSGPSKRWCALLCPCCFSSHCPDDM